MEVFKFYSGQSELQQTDQPTDDAPESIPIYDTTCKLHLLGV